MQLKIYELKDPINGGVSTVFEYPSCLVSPMYAFRECTLVSKEPLKIPIIIAPDIYLTEKKDQREGMDVAYVYMELWHHWQDELEKNRDSEKKSDRLAALRSSFPNLIVSSQLDQDTMFFTGPKLVYKRTFKEKWSWVAGDRFALTGIGLFRTIESLSLKSPNEMFVTGTFECGDEVVGNTQCKIIIKKK